MFIFEFNNLSVIRAVDHDNFQTQAFQSVYEDCSRLDRVFQTMETKDSNNAGNDCLDSAPGGVNDSHPENKNNCNSETRDNMNKLVDTTGNSDSSASKKSEVSIKDPYRL